MVLVGLGEVGKGRDQTKWVLEEGNEEPIDCRGLALGSIFKRKRGIGSMLVKAFSITRDKNTIQIV